MAEQRKTGVVKSFDIAKGYGYVEVEDFSEPVFVHYSSIAEDRYQLLEAGDEVELLLEEVPEGARSLEVKKL